MSTPDESLDRIAIPLLSRLRAESAGRKDSTILGTYHTFSTMIELSSLRTDKDFHSAMEFREQYLQQMRKVQPPETFSPVEVARATVNILTSAIPLAPSLREGVETQDDAVKVFNTWVDATVRYVRATAKQEPDECLLLRNQAIAAAGRATVPLHERAHLLMARGSSAQMYSNWLTWIQTTLVAGFVNKAKAASLAMQSAPLFEYLQRPSAGGEQFNLSYRLRNWWYVEHFQNVLAGVVNIPVKDAVVLASTVDSLFKFQIVLSGVKLPLRSNWNVEISLPPHSCPQTEDGKPYGMQSIHEAFATLLTDFNFGLSYQDLLKGKQNPLYHGEYFRLVSHAVRRMKVAYPDFFRFTFLAICDLAMSSHLHPALLDEFSDTFNYGWHDLHRGWRFERILDLVSSTEGLIVLDPSKDYLSFIETVCKEFKWPSPTAMAGALLHFTGRLNDVGIISTLTNSDRYASEVRRDEPYYFVQYTHLRDKFKPSVTRTADGFLFEAPDESAWMSAALQLFVDEVRAYVIEAKRPQHLNGIFRLRENIDILYKIVEAHTGVDLNSLWDTPAPKTPGI